MPGYLQIEGDPTKWWPAQPFTASQLTGQPLSIQVLEPAMGTLVLSGKAASVVVFEASSQTGPDGTVGPEAPSIYVPTGAGLSTGHLGYELPASANLTNLANQIMASMRSGQSETITLNGGGTLVLNGATLSFVVLLSPVGPSVGGPTPHG